MLRPMLLALEGQGGLCFCGKMSHRSLDLTHVGAFLASGQAQGGVVGAGLVPSWPLTTSVLLLQRSAGSSSPEAGEGKEVSRTLSQILGADLSTP